MIALNTDVELLVTDNLPLVPWMFQRCRRAPEIDAVVQLGHGDDLISAGNMGLMKAAQTYKPDRAKFSTHAALLIRQAIFKEARRLCNQNRLGAIPLDEWRCADDALPPAEPDERLDSILALLENHPKRTQWIVRARLGLGCVERTCKDIGLTLGMTPQHVSYLYRMAIKEIQFSLVDSAPAAD